MTPAPYTAWRKHWPGAAHGQRYTYSVLRVELTLMAFGSERHIVHWRRSDGLKGSTPMSEWSAYTPNGKPQPTWREVRWGKKR